MITKPDNSLIKHPDQIGVTNRNLLIKVMDTLGCSKREALMLMASLRALEKQHPEYHIEKLPQDKLLDMMRQIRLKQQDTHNLNQGLNGSAQDHNNLDQALNQGK